MLPSDNVYLSCAMQANDEYAELGWEVRVAAVRMEEPGELEVALVVPGDEPGALVAGLDALPGHSEVLDVLHRRLKAFGHSVHPQYFTNATWRDAAGSPLWRYTD